jgi:hypothetical protein
MDNLESVGVIAGNVGTVRGDNIWHSEQFTDNECQYAIWKYEVCVIKHITMPYTQITEHRKRNNEIKRHLPDTTNIFLETKTGNTDHVKVAATFVET